MKYNDNGTYKDIYVKSFDTTPIGAEFDYDGETVPSGYVQVDETPIYSTTTEQVIGTWTNNKPLYRKLVTGVVPTTSSDGTDVTGAIFVADNIDEMIIEWGYVRANNNTTDLRKRQLPFITTSGYRISLTSKCDSNGGAASAPFNYIAISNNYAGYSDREIMVSVLFTKTTD